MFVCVCACVDVRVCACVYRCFARHNGRAVIDFIERSNRLQSDMANHPARDLYVTR